METNARPRWAGLVVPLLVVTLVIISGVALGRKKEFPVIRKLTPILYVEEIEPVLPFWTDRLRFAVTTEVPQGDNLGFVILEKDGIEVMYQTRASVQADVPAVSGTPVGGSILFIEVDDLEGLMGSLEGVPIVVPRRKTPYGADEIFVREPGGHLIGFASF
jgi:hypothetical protein